jgi:predicted transcriptional regulator
LKREFAVKKPLEHAATVRFDSELWQRVEQLAADERRPISHLIRNLVEDAVAGHSGGDPPNRAGMVAA